MGMTSTPMHNRMGFAASSPTPRPNVPDTKAPLLVLNTHRLSLQKNYQRSIFLQYLEILGNQKSSEETEQNFIQMGDPYIYT